MGASTFDVYSANPEPAEAFADAVAAAEYEYGHGGYTGTIAEKDSYVIVETSPLSLQAAEALAYKLIDDGDERIDDKWGPAGAIPIASANNGALTVGWVFFGWASS